MTLTRAGTIAEEMTGAKIAMPPIRMMTSRAGPTLSWMVLRAST